MPNTIIITPKALAIIVLASAGKEVGSFIIQLPNQLVVHKWLEIETRKLVLRIGRLS